MVCDTSSNLYLPRFLRGTSCYSRWCCRSAVTWQAVIQPQLCDVVTVENMSSTMNNVDLDIATDAENIARKRVYAGSGSLPPLLLCIQLTTDGTLNDSQPKRRRSSRLQGRD